MPHDGGGQVVARRRRWLAKPPRRAARAGCVWQLPGCLAFSPPPLSTFPPKTDGHPRPARVVFVKAVVQIHSHTSGKNSCELGSSLSSGKQAPASGDFACSPTFGFKRATGAHTPLSPGCVYFLTLWLPRVVRGIPTPSMPPTRVLSDPSFWMEAAPHPSPPLANSPGTCILAVFGRLQPFGEQRF